MDAFDVAVIGAGPGGYVAAIRAAQLGGKVALIEKEEVGGTCLNKGCIPTKAMLKSSELFLSINKASKFGINVANATIDAQQVMDRKSEVVRRLVRGVHFLVSKNKISLFRGIGSILEPNVVQVKTQDGYQTLSTKKIIIATGTKIAKPPLAGVELALTTDDILELRSFAESIFIVGGGASGVEFATMFSGFGKKVVLIEMLPHLLPGEDKEVGQFLEKVLSKRGVQVLTNTKLGKIEESTGKRKVTVNNGAGERTFEADLVLLAAGRKPNTEELGSEKIGLSLEKGRVVVNEKMETNVAGVYAAGDVVGKYPYAHVASAEGVVAAENAMGYPSIINYRAVPRCIFTLPEVAAVGLTEEQARANSANIKVGKFQFQGSGKALILDEYEGFVKVLSDAESGEILGVHIIGPTATELIPESVLAINFEATIDDVIGSIHAHPTLAESVKEAFLDCKGEAIHK